MKNSSVSIITVTRFSECWKGYWIFTAPEEGNILARWTHSLWYRKR